MNPPLTGRISHRLALPKEDKKRKLTHSANIGVVQPFGGWQFTTQQQQQQLGGSAPAATTSYFLSVPLPLLKQAAEACRSKQLISLENYKVLPISDSQVGASLSALIEVPVDGWKIANSAAVASQPQHADAASSKPYDEPWNLRDIARLEAINQDEDERSAVYSFRARVTAISPVIISDPNDPFSLLELNDEDCHCFAVLRKDGLSCHPAILPGDTVDLSGVTKRKWRIPELLQQQPKHSDVDEIVFCPLAVFVVDMARKIHSYAELKTGSHIDEAIYGRVMRGKVESIHMLVIGRQDHRILHFVEIRTGDNRKVSMFLTYFPMSTDLQLSLRPGASIYATNVSELGLGGYYLSLRSSLTVTSFSPGSPRDDASWEPLSLSNASPYHLMKVKRSYAELWLRRLILCMIDKLELQGGNSEVLRSLDNCTRSLLDILQKSKSGSRKVYSEFLNPHVYFGFFGNQPVLESQHLPTIPLGLDLHKIQALCVDYMASATKSFIDNRQSELRPGWAGSLTVSKDLLLHLYSEQDSCREPRPVFTTGRVNGLSSMDGHTSFTLADSKVILPVVFSYNSTPLSNFDGSVGCALVRLGFAVVSCICIEVMESGKDGISTAKKHLPMYSMERESRSTTSGSTTIIAVKGHVFMISVSLFADSILPSVACSTSAETNNNACGAIKELLEGNYAANSERSASSASVLGLLVRSRYSISHAKTSVFSGTMLTFAHNPDPLATGRSEHVSTLQSIEVRPPISLSNSQRCILVENIAFLVNQSISKNGVALGLAWWKIASCGRTCGLLFGGWDDVEGNRQSPGHSLGIVVRIPRSALQHCPKRGFSRFRCGMEDLTASMRVFQQVENSGVDLSQRTDWFDSIGVGKFFAGMLDKRPKRRQYVDGRSFGDLLVESYDSGVKTYSITEIFNDMCADLKMGSRLNLSPSLVRQIRGARFIGVSYCRALAECSLCHQPLRGPSSIATVNQKEAADSIVPSVSVLELEQKSFWNHAIDPAGIRQPSTKHARAMPTENVRAPRRNTPLQCTNRCNVDLHGEIKWECSGTLDDGTGQATLYAERETAMCLLGMSLSELAHIEEAAWLDSTGVVFSKAAPPPAYIRQAVLNARFCALNHQKLNGVQRPHLQENEVLLFLKPRARAAYLMQRHCRDSKIPLRQVTYYVRCKPLSTGVSHLNQTEIKTAWGQDVATYSLPPLKLVLVDCLTHQPNYRDHVGPVTRGDP